MIPQEYDAAVAAFIRTNGITRCPTACALPTQATIAAADRTALENHAAKREMLRHQRSAAGKRLLWAFKVPALAGK